MWSVVAFTLAVLISATQSKCKGGCNIPVKHYEEMGCRPIFAAPNDCCPKLYDCSALKQRSPDKCYFKGNEYMRRETLNDSLVGVNCLAACFCNPEGDSLRGSDFTCAQIDCPEFFGVPLGKGCYRKYVFDHCCSIEDVCPPLDNVPKCLYEGRVYYEGERFQPRSGCLSCICQKDFRGNLEWPYCDITQCGIEITNSKDMIANHPPIYYGTDRCCPIGWLEPSEEDEISCSITSRSDSGYVCHYGDKTVQIGTKVFPKGKDNIKCECKIPPLVTCVQDKY